ADEATTWIKSLQAVPGVQYTPQMALLAARALTLQGRGQQGAGLLLKMLPTERPLPQEQWPLLRQGADALKQVGQLEPADKLWREDVGYEPQQIPALAELLAQEGKVAAPRNLLDQNRKAIPPALMIQIEIIALRQNIQPPTEEQIQKVEKLIDRA